MFNELIRSENHHHIGNEKLDRTVSIRKQASYLTFLTAR